MNKLQVLMLALVVISAIAVVGVRHHNRLAFVALQKEEQKRVDLQAEWGRLMLEKATWTRQHNVADTAKKQLTMAPPSPDKIITLDLAPKSKAGDQ